MFHITHGDYMILPQDLQEKINKLYLSLNKKTLTETQKNLTDKYKNQTGKSTSLIDSKTDSVLYAISRMPATYSVIHTLVSELEEQGLIENVETVLDMGAGTGTGYFALKDIDEDLQITLVERDRNMIDVFKTLSDENVEVVRDDVLKFETDKKFDLVLTSYVLSEMTENDRLSAVSKMLEKTNKYLLIVDTGTPKTYENMMTVKRHIEKSGYHVIAPCMSEKCRLANDYCQFYARVERSALHKLAKSGTLSYEDEKYFYLLISKETKQVDGERVIRRPIIKENNIELLLCSKQGVQKTIYTKKNKELFKKAKKVKINGLM